MKPSRASTVLKEMLATRWPVFLWGPPGAGKSSVVRDVAQESGLDLVDIRASLLDPTDLRGIPTVENGRARWSPPSFLPNEEQRPGLLFFDELNAAPPLIQASLYQLVLDRRVGEYELPAGWHIVAAGNRQEDRSVVFRMPAALANRFVHLDFEVDYDDWRAWAVANEVHPLVIGYLALQREQLSTKADGSSHAFATPRSWEIASDAIKTLGLDGSVKDVLVGIVGEGAAIGFLGYSESTLTEKDVQRVLANPAKARLPTELGKVYALVSYITARGADEAVMAAAGILLSRLEPEFAVLLTRDLLRVSPSFVADPGYVAFIQNHQELLL